MSSNLEKYDSLLESYYLSHNVFQESISLAIDKNELEDILKPIQHTFGRFARTVGGYWWNTTVEAGIYKPGFLSIAALQIIAGSRPDSVELPSDERFMRYIIELAGDANETRDRNSKYLFYGKSPENKKQERAKQELIWFGIRSFFRRTHELNLYLPGPRKTAGRFIQYPKTHVLFREQELKDFAKAYFSQHNHDSILSAGSLLANASDTWKSYRRYFPATANNRLEHEESPEKRQLYMEQVKRYLTRISEYQLQELLTSGSEDFSTIQNKLRRIRSVRSNIRPYYLEQDWDGEYELFLDGEYQQLIDSTEWNFHLNENGGCMVFGANEEYSGILNFLGSKLQASSCNGPVIELLISEDKRSVSISKYNSLEAYADQHDLSFRSTTSAIKVSIPQLSGGLRLGREASYLLGLGPEVNITEGCSLSIERFFLAKKSKASTLEYSPQNSPAGLWIAKSADRSTRFSIEAPKKTTIPIRPFAFDLSTFSFKTGEMPAVAARFMEPKPLKIDLLEGFSRVREQLEDADRLEVFPHSQAVPDQLDFFAKADQRSLFEDTISPSHPVFIDAIYDTLKNTWTPNMSGAISQVQKMLDICYPKAESDVAQRLLAALQQPLPLVAANTTQVVSLAATTGAARTYITTPLKHKKSVPDLHSNVIRHAIKAAKRNNGSAHRFVFVAIDLSESLHAIETIDKIIEYYGISKIDAELSNVSIPDNLYLSFVLEPSVRKELGALADQYSSPLFFVNGGWGIPEAASLRNYKGFGAFPSFDRHLNMS